MTKFSRFYPIIILFFVLLFTGPVMALELNIKDHKGKTYDLNEYKGKWLVLNYWATWCPPCLKEIPMLSDYDESHDNVEVFGLHYERSISQEKLNNFIDSYLISYPIIPMTRELIEKLGDARALPMTVFVSPDGKIFKKHVGLLTEKFMNEVIQ
ncbi:MAG: TlpA family protein disulfide reductase [Gammaproteobacteria bacterium]|nr:TlpA family protein disulfide reductase [Gammaproteobacteria bacterium]